MKHGYGSEYTIESNEYFTGNWKYGKKSGKGILYYPAGWSRYEGEWKDDMYHGFGTLRYSNNYYYKGNFIAGKEHGEGELFFPNEIKFSKNL